MDIRLVVVRVKSAFIENPFDDQQPHSDIISEMANLGMSPTLPCIPEAESSDMTLDDFVPRKDHDVLPDPGFYGIRSVLSGVVPVLPPTSKQNMDMVALCNITGVHIASSSTPPSSPPPTSAASASSDKGSNVDDLFSAVCRAAYEDISGAVSDKPLASVSTPSLPSSVQSPEPQSLRISPIFPLATTGPHTPPSDVQGPAGDSPFPNNSGYSSFSSGDDPSRVRSDHDFPKPVAPTNNCIDEPMPTKEVALKPPRSGPMAAKKPTTLTALIGMAILSSKGRRMILSDIISYIIREFPYIRTDPVTWKNAIRHNLSVNPCFVQSKNSYSESGLGYHWSIHRACLNSFLNGDFRRSNACRLVQLMETAKPTARKSGNGTRTNGQPAGGASNSPTAPVSRNSLPIIQPPEPQEFISPIPPLTTTGAHTPPNGSHGPGRSSPSTSHSGYPPLSSGGDPSIPVSDPDFPMPVSPTSSCFDEPMPEVEAPLKPPRPGPVPVKKPTDNYIALIGKAILSAPGRRMILSNIMNYILQEFPCYRTAPVKCKATVRYTLRANDCFVKNGTAGSGRGYYWSIHPACLDTFLKGDFDRGNARRLVALTEIANDAITKSTNAAHSCRKSAAISKVIATRGLHANAKATSVHGAPSHNTLDSSMTIRHTPNRPVMHDGHTVNHPTQQHTSLVSSMGYPFSMHSNHAAAQSTNTGHRGLQTLNTGTSCITLRINQGSISHAPNQWEKPLQSSVVSHWRSACTEWSLIK